MAATTTRRRTRAVACGLALVVLFGTAGGVAAAADTTSILVSPGTDSLESGDTTTVNVAVEDADGGVGALNATVTLSNPDVASVEDVTIHGEPRLSDVTERPDGVALSAALADTDDSGSVTVASVVLRGENPGETAVQVDVRALGDENGAAYSVATIDRPTLTIVEDEPLDVDGWSSSNPDDETDGDGDDAGDGDGDSGNADDGDGVSDDDPADIDDPADTGDDDSNDDQPRDDPPADQTAEDSSLEDLDDEPATPDDDSGPPFDPANAVVVAGTVALVAFVVYRVW